MRTEAHRPHARQAPQNPAPGLTPAAAQARLQQAFAGKRRRPIRWALSAIGAVWALSAAYYTLTPASYVSKWTLILPVSNNSPNISLDTIGHTSTTQAQTFGSITLSPKVIYREIANSEQVRQQAAASLGMDASAFGRARVRLIDETSLMLFQITGGSPEDAQRRARALMGAFQGQLDQLRRDETEKRAVSLRENLKQYQANLDVARDRIVEFQRTSGLRSINQFNDSVSSAELIRRKLAEVRSDIEKGTRNQVVLMSRIGLRPHEAAAALRLAADPAFAKLATVYAEASATLHEHRHIYGPNHPALSTARFKLNGALAEFDRIARANGVDQTVDLQSLIVVLNGSQQAELLRQVVASESLLAGQRREVEAMTDELARLEGEITRMSGDAVRLENLKKDHLVAEAVLTSAVARLDTSKADVYSSYPIVQLLAEPDLPEARSQPQLLIAIAAGLAGTLLIVLAWGATWVRGAFRPNRPRRRSSTGSSSPPGESGLPAASTSSAR